MINIEKNWKQFIELLTTTQREGVKNLIQYLVTKTNIKDTVASTKFHLSIPGGLVQHSLNVLKFARVINKELNLETSEESLILTSLLHDLCKVNFYIQGEEWDKEWKDKTNQWRKKAVWKVDDQLPLGHGEKSLYLVGRFVDLTPDEACAIRWHMLSDEAGVNFNYPSGFPYRSALEKYSLVKVLALADRMAELFESKEEVK